jgi:activator of 2-hydroxyglutaryl-CoA dehydratase
MSVVWIGNGFSNENMKEQETQMKKMRKMKTFRTRKHQSKHQQAWG